MPSRQFILGHGNIHNHGKAVATALTMDADVFGFNEAHKVGRIIRSAAKVRGYRFHAAQPLARQHDTTGDCTTIVKDKHEYLGEWQQQVSQEVAANTRLGPDRWFNVVCFAYGDLRVAHVNIHPNAGPAIRKAGTPLTKEYAESMEWLDTILDVYARQNYALLVSGDFNLPDMPRDPEWSPWPRIAAHGLASRTKHIDGICWSRKHFDLNRFTVVPKEKFGSDHPAIRAVLEVK